jgi:hypothetical protein
MRIDRFFRFALAPFVVAIVLCGINAQAAEPEKAEVKGDYTYGQCEVKDEASSLATTEGDVNCIISCEHGVYFTHADSEFDCWRMMTVIC